MLAVNYTNVAATPHNRIDPHKKRIQQAENQREYREIIQENHNLRGEIEQLRRELEHTKNALKARTDRDNWLSSWLENPLLKKDRQLRGVAHVAAALYTLIKDDDKDPTIPRIITAPEISNLTGLSDDRNRTYGVMLDKWGFIERKTTIRTDETGKRSSITTYALTEQGLKPLPKTYKPQKMPVKSVAGACKTCKEHALVITELATKKRTEKDTVKVERTLTEKQTQVICYGCGATGPIKTRTRATHKVLYEATATVDVAGESGINTAPRYAARLDDDEQAIEESREQNPYRNEEALNALRAKSNRPALRGPVELNTAPRYAARLEEQVTAPRNTEGYIYTNTYELRGPVETTTNAYNIGKGTDRGARETLVIPPLSAPLPIGETNQNTTPATLPPAPAPAPALTFEEYLAHRVLPPALARLDESLDVARRESEAR